MKRLFFCLVLFSLISCRGNDQIPGNIIPPQKMQLVLEDLMKADQFLSDYVLNRDTTKKREPESIKIYDQVFALHEITANKFYKSFSYYKQHPVLLQPIMDSLSKPIKAQSVEALPAIIDDTVTSPTFRPIGDTITKRKVIKLKTLSDSVSF